MIRVTIEMVPGGIEEHKYLMHIIEISNQVLASLRNPRRGDYRYKISRKFTVDSKRPSWHKTGQVNGFPRANKNSVHLLLAVLKDAYDE